MKKVIRFAYFLARLLKMPYYSVKLGPVAACKDAIGVVLEKLKDEVDFIKLVSHAVMKITLPESKDILVYRIENEYGDGPYQHLLNPELLLEAHNRFEYPDIYRDAGLLPGERCGFISIPQCIRWFNGFLLAFKDEGFLLAVYKVNSLYVHFGASGKQLCFDKSQAQLVKVIGKSNVKESLLTV